jgi:magnesium-transporting ATPase (P-type)
MAPASKSLNDWVWSRLGDDWFFTTSGKRILSWAFLASIGCLIGLSLPDFPAQIPGSPPLLHSLLYAIYVLLSTVLPFGGIILFLGMFRYWFRLDTSPKSRRSMWFWILLLGTVLGACLYYIFVYCTQVREREEELGNGMRKLLRITWGIVFGGAVALLLFARVHGPVSLSPVIFPALLILLTVLSVWTVALEVREYYRKAMRR